MLENPALRERIWIAVNAVQVRPNEKHAAVITDGDTGMEAMQPSDAGGRKFTASSLGGRPLYNRSLEVGEHWPPEPGMARMVAGLDDGDGQDWSPWKWDNGPRVVAIVWRCRR